MNVYLWKDVTPDDAAVIRVDEVMGGITYPQGRPATFKQTDVLVPQALIKAYGAWDDAVDEHVNGAAFSTAFDYNT